MKSESNGGVYVIDCLRNHTDHGWCKLHGGCIDPWLSDTWVRGVSEGRALFPRSSRFKHILRSTTTTTTYPPALPLGRWLRPLVAALCFLERGRCDGRHRSLWQLCCCWFFLHRSSHAHAGGRRCESIATRGVGTSEQHEYKFKM